MLVQTLLIRADHVWNELVSAAPLVQTPVQPVPLPNPVGRKGRSVTLYDRLARTTRVTQEGLAPEPGRHAERTEVPAVPAVPATDQFAWVPSASKEMGACSEPATAESEEHRAKLVAGDTAPPAGQTSDRSPRKNAERHRPFQGRSRVEAAPRGSPGSSSSTAPQVAGPTQVALQARSNALVVVGHQVESQDVVAAPLCYQRHRSYAQLHRYGGR
mmetsp:Transcript_61203/g.162676  ORF Transcript_61203/g.162676 Transcript_61203/m.162676 type:complete len:215 (+) Transcript_61203:461-1105(+)